MHKTTRMHTTLVDLIMYSLVCITTSSKYYAYYAYSLVLYTPTLQYYYSI